MSLPTMKLLLLWLSLLATTTAYQAGSPLFQKRPRKRDRVKAWVQRSTVAFTLAGLALSTVPPAMAAPPARSFRFQEKKAPEPQKPVQKGLPTGLVTGSGVILTAGAAGVVLGQKYRKDKDDTPLSSSPSDSRWTALRAQAKRLKSLFESSPADEESDVADDVAARNRALIDEDPFAGINPDTIGTLPDMTQIIASDASDTDAPLAWKEKAEEQAKPVSLEPVSENDSDVPLLWRELKARAKGESVTPLLPWEKPTETPVDDEAVETPTTEEPVAEGPVEESVVAEEEPAKEEAPAPSPITMDNLEAEIEIPSPVPPAAMNTAVAIPTEIEADDVVPGMPRGKAARLLYKAMPKSYRRQLALSQPKPKLEEEALQRKYAAIPDVEERAFQILLDLGLVEKHDKK